MNYHVPIFDPIRHRGDDFFHPGNDSALYLMQIQYVYKDIVKLYEILSTQNDEYGKKLITKYVVIEWISLNEYLQKLINIIIKDKSDYELNHSEKSKTKELYKEYKEQRKKYFKELEFIRNKLAAHRDPLNFLEIANIWDSIDPQSILEILTPLPKLFNYIKALNLYTWTKEEITENGKVVAFVQPFKYNSANSVDAKSRATD